MKNILITAVVAIIASLITWQVLPAKGGETIAKKESVYERVMRTKKIRCGWFIEQPFTEFDEQTQQPTGLSVDLINQIAKDFNWEVVWQEQINFGTFPQDLKNGRYDAICGSIFALPRNALIDYTAPYAVIPLYGYVRADNPNLDKPFSAIDWSQVTIAGIDGEAAIAAAARLLPEANIETLPQASSIGEVLTQVASNKADIAFAIPSVFGAFNKNNPGKLKQADLGGPLYKIEITFGVPADEVAFKDIISNAIRRYQVGGELAALHAKYDPAGLLEQPTN